MLFAVYAATLGIDARGGSDYAGDEPHLLLAAESIADGGVMDLADEYRERTWASCSREPLVSRRATSSTDGSTSRTASASRC